MIAPAIVVHGAAHARAALAPALPVTLLSARGAALGGGCLWWAALVAQARAAFPATPCVDLLDCADAPGLAMAALRAGVQGVILDGNCPAFAAVAGAGASLGAVVRCDRPAALDLGALGLGAWGVERRIAAWLAGGDRRADVG